MIQVISEESNQKHMIKIQKLGQSAAISAAKRVPMNVEVAFSKSVCLQFYVKLKDVSNEDSKDQKSEDTIDQLDNMDMDDQTLIISKMGKLLWLANWYRFYISI